VFVARHQGEIVREHGRASPDRGSAARRRRDGGAKAAVAELAEELVDDEDEEERGEDAALAEAYLAEDCVGEEPRGDVEAIAVRRKYPLLQNLCVAPHKIIVLMIVRGICGELQGRTAPLFAKITLWT
jgi:hypothetical protein